MYENKFTMEGGEYMKSTMKKVLIGALTVATLAMPIAAMALDTGINYGTATQLGTQDVRSTIATVINVMLGLLGIVALVIVLAGGAMWMMAGGDEEKVGKAKALLSAGALGLVILLAAYAIASFVVNQVVDATT